MYLDPLSIAETWQELVAKILNPPYLRVGEDLYIEKARKFQQSLEVWDSLLNGIYNTGLQFAYGDGTTN